MKNKILKVFLALMMAFGIQVASLGNVFAAADLSVPGTYTVPVAGLESAAPMTPVKVAFAKAFGDSIEVTVDEEGNKVATVTLQHMVILMGEGNEFHANVMTIENGTILSSKTEKSTLGMSGETVEKTVPEKISFPLSQLNDEGVAEFKITVDFMDELLGGGNPFQTGVTLTLDVENATVKNPTVENPVVNETESSFKIYYNGQSGQFESRFSDTATVKEYADGTYTISVTAQSLGDAAEYVDVEEPENVTYVDNEDGTRTFTFVVSKEELYNQHAFKFAYYIIAMGRTNTHDFMLELVNADDEDNEEPSEPSEPTQPSDPDEKDDTNNNNQYSYLTKDGTYTVNVSLWNADKDQPSMAASALDEKATIVVKDGKATMYLTTKKMTMGSIEACLQELYIGTLNSDYKSHPATIVSKDSEGNPTMWSFAIDSETEFIDVVMNPHVALMGNMDLGARIKVDYTTLAYVSESTSDPEAPKTDNTSSNKNSSSVKTGDSTSVELMGGLLVVSLAALAYFMKKRLCK